MRKIRRNPTPAFFAANESTALIRSNEKESVAQFTAAAQALEHTLNENLPTSIRDAGLIVLKLAKEINTEAPDKKPILIKSLLSANEAIKKPRKKNIKALNSTASALSRGSRLCRALAIGTCWLGFGLLVIGTVLNCLGLAPIGLPIMIVGGLLFPAMGFGAAMYDHPSRRIPSTEELDNGMRMLASTLHPKEGITELENPVGAPIVGM